MAADQQPSKRAHPLAVIVAAGLLLLGAATLINSIRQRSKYLPGHAGVPPMPERQVEQRQRLRENVTPPEPGAIPQRDIVLVINTAIGAGEEIIPEFVDEKAVGVVLRDHPELAKESLSAEDEKRGGGSQKLLGFCKDKAQVEGRYAALDLKPGTPLMPSMVLDRAAMLASLSPEERAAFARDERRRDRFTIAMPPEPTLYPLLQPGDRVDVFLVLDGQSVREAMSDVRVVAVNNIATEDAQVGTARGARRMRTVRGQAASRKAARMRAQQAAAGTTPATPEAAPAAEPTTPEQAPPPAQAGEQGQTGQPEAGATAGQGEAQGQGTTAGGEEKQVPEGAVVAGREFEGQTLTLQVNRAEGMVLAMTHRSPHVQLDFALHARP